MCVALLFVYRNGCRLWPRSFSGAELLSRELDVGGAAHQVTSNTPQEQNRLKSSAQSQLRRSVLYQSNFA